MEERLDVARRHVALRKRQPQRGVRRIAGKAQKHVVGSGNPQRVALREQRACGRVLLDGAAKPSSSLDGVLERDGRGVMLERLGHEDDSRCSRGRRGRSIRRGVLLACGCHARGVSAKAGKPAREPREAQRREGLSDLGGVESWELGVGELDVDGGIGADGRDLAGEQGVVHVRAEVLAHLALDLVRVGNDLVEVTVLHDERGSLLGTNTRHARDVVRGVALEAVEVWHQVGGDAVVEVVDALGSHDLDLGDALLGGDDLYVFGC